ncbi:MAG: hypothetical protein M3R72_10650 [Bacteroidota bacterium]|nr:hypothetical protein [Bacteroidota bacterium]
MKTILFFLIMVLFVFAHISCSKTYSANPAMPHISGNWKIAIDSNYTGWGMSNHLEIYKGGGSDYFNFNSDSNLYIKEGNTLDTLPYHITSDSTMIIATFGLVGNNVPETTTITNLTSHTLTITAQFSFSPDGVRGRIVHLMR